METRRIQPLMIILALMLAATLAASRVGEPQLAPAIGVRRPLPAQIARFHGHELLFCSNVDCAEAYGSDEFEHVDTDVCPLCGSALDSMAPIERQLLPQGTTIMRSIYRGTDGSSFFVAVVIGGRDRLSLHRPENCLPGQGLSIRASRILETALPHGEMLQTRLLDVRRQLGGSDAAVFSHFTYWYVAPQRETPLQWKLYAWMAADRLLHARMDRWAYVAVAHDFEPSRQSVSQTALQEFLRSLHPAIVL